jgi:hypothetical protein
VTGADATAEAAATPPAAPAGRLDGQDFLAMESPPAPAAAAPAQGAAHLAKTIGSVVAPTTLLTGVLYYFGFQNTYSFFYYFGADPTALHLTAADYITRSVGPLVVPIIVAAILALLALWGDGALRARIAKGPRTRSFRILVPVMAGGGLLLAAGGLLSPLATREFTLVAGERLGLAVGVLLLGYAVRMRRHLAAREHGPDSGSYARAAGWEWALVFLIVAVCLFVAADDYGIASGRSNAQQFVAGLPNYPDVSIYSARSLSLHAPGVRQVRCHDPQAAYGFRYDGLRLVPESGGQYLFLPMSWTRAQGVVFLIPQSSAIRLDFYPASTSHSPPPSTC